jgi:hypothetical protein
MVSDFSANIALPAPLAAAVDEALAEAFSRSFFADPLFGPDLTAIRAPLDSVCRRHGILIERAIAHALAAHDRYDVQTQVAVPISRAALDLCETNGEGATEKIAMPVSGGRIRTVVLDLVVYDRKEQRLILVSVKRGGGFQGGAAARDARIEQRAAAVILRSMVASQGLSVQRADAIVVDWYGRSGILGGAVVTGAQIDAFFGVSVAAVVQAMTERLSTGVRERANEILQQFHVGPTTVTPAAVRPTPVMTTSDRPNTATLIDLSQCLASLPRRRRGRPMRAVRAAN